MIVWPSHFPDSCPPSHATAVSGLVYRFTNRSNPKHKDFLSYYELNPGHDWGEKACEARGLSVYRAEEDCLAAAARVPALRKKRLAKAFLPHNSGVIAPTKSSNTKNHHTFWALVGAQDLAPLFTPVHQMGVANV
ncbi:hypothetical protein D3C78_838750 [compost metagenome]